MPEVDVAAVVTRLANQHGFQVQERAVLSSREPVYEPVPKGLHGKIAEVLAQEFPRGLYAHQAKAIAALLRGQDVSVATGTASGKSLIFMAGAAHLVLSNPESRILAIYPARALIQDQLEKWMRFGERVGYRVGVVDGGVPRDLRKPVLDSCPVVLMTPDVVHAWLLPCISDGSILSFLKRTHMLVLDEAHVYDGVFGTNMCFLMRRVLAFATNAKVVVSSATLRDAKEFARQLVGRELFVLGPEDDGAGAPNKTVLLASAPGRGKLEGLSKLLRSAATQIDGRFIAFADSRKTVEMVVSIMVRGGGSKEEGFDDSEDALGDEGVVLHGPRQVLPYRAGYETEDRKAIQEALARGRLAGVVSTSALELGLDIGEITLVVLLNAPNSIKSFWQRMGRAGRRSDGVCLMIDSESSILSQGRGALGRFLNRTPEPNWLYVKNRYIQYANALCAAYELKSSEERHVDKSVFDTLPDSFRQMLGNELNPTEAVPQDLYSLKQRAQDSPHLEFPLRTCMEQSFDVVGPFDKRLGTLSYSQVLREAYPGAIYYYVAWPYRVIQVQQKSGIIRVRKEKRWTTEPLSQVKVFPNFDGGTLRVLRSADGFVAEAEVQVSEQVLGFVEKKGQSKEEHRYGPGSSYAQRELSHFFETTGVCWYFPDGYGSQESVAHAIRSAFCSEFGIQEKDLGVGSFHARRSPMGEGVTTGVCIYDATSGSLRLTQMLGENFGAVLRKAAHLCEYDGDTACAMLLRQMKDWVDTMVDSGAVGAPTVSQDLGRDWVTVVRSGSRAMLVAPEGAEEVMVIGYRYTPQGLMYDLEPRKPGVRWSVRYEVVLPINGTTECVRYNLMTGEESAG